MIQPRIPGQTIADHVYISYNKELPRTFNIAASEPFLKCVQHRLEDGRGVRPVSDETGDSFVLHLHELTSVSWVLRSVSVVLLSETPSFRVDPSPHSLVVYTLDEGCVCSHPSTTSLLDQTWRLPSLTPRDRLDLFSVINQHTRIYCVSVG